VTLPDRVTRTDGTFTADAADSNRLLTRWRGVIERVNRQLKICKLLSKSYPNSELCTSPVYWRASAIMCNKYRHASLTRFDQPARFVLLSSLMLYIDYHIDASSSDTTTSSNTATRLPGQELQQRKKRGRPPKAAQPPSPDTRSTDSTTSSTDDDAAKRTQTASTTNAPTRQSVPTAKRQRKR
jgi:hypothetical protein